MTWTDFKYWYKNNRAETWTIVGVSLGALVLLGGAVALVVWMGSDTSPTVATAQAMGARLVPPASQTPADPPKIYDYNPPAVEVEYRKEYIEGEIEVVKWNGDGPYTEEKLGDKVLPHYVPDWTDVVYLPPGDDTREETIQFCGNVLNKFDPHTKIKMMLHATNVGDYNDCYKSSAPLSFGGKPTPPSNIVKPSV